jgi:LPS export ABC transporter permease LptG/LPS export ABC transporter permease LptF
MRRLDRYIFREILTPGLIALVALTFIVFASRRGGAGLLLDIIIRQAPTASEIWTVVAAILPVVLTVTIPMAVLMGILTGFSRMSSDSETIALRASGISMHRILRPVLVFATLAWAVTLTLTFWVAPRTTANLRAITATLALRHPSIELRPRVFFEKGDWPYTLYVNDSRAGNGIQASGILLVDTQNPDEPEFVFAESGSIVVTSSRNLQLTLSNSSRHVGSAIDPERYAIFAFPETNTLSIETPDPGVRPVPPVTETSTSELWARLRSGTATLEETVEFHQRLAMPFACFAFALVGLPLGVSTSRGGRSTGLVLSLFLMFTYYIALVGATRTTTGGNFLPFLAAWLPNIGFSILGIYLLSRADRQHENRIITSIARSLEWGSSRLASVKMPRVNVSRWAYAVSHRVKLFRLLDAYVLRGFWFFFAIVLSVFSSLFIVVTLFELLQDIVTRNVSIGIIVAYFVYLLPQIFYWVVPLAVLLAILINLGTLTKTNEVLAVKAGAVSLYRLSLPLILMGALLSGAVYVMQDYVLPWTNKRQDEYRNVIKGKAPQTFNDPHRKLMMGSGNQIYHYTFFNPDTSTFANLTIFSLHPQTFQPRQRLFAKRAAWSGTNWIFEEGWLRQFSEGKETSYEPFAQLPVHSMDPPVYFKSEVREADQMNYSELQTYVEDLRKSGFDVGSLTVDLYRKLSFPLVSFIMALIGVPFSFKTGRKGAFYGIGFCLAIGIIYWLTFELFGKLGGISQLSPFVAAWFPNLIFGASGFWMMLRLKT